MISLEYVGAVGILAFLWSVGVVAVTAALYFGTLTAWGWRLNQWWGYPILFVLAYAGLYLAFAAAIHLFGLLTA